MGDNLKLRSFIVVVLVALCLWRVGEPLLLRNESPLTLGLDIRGGVSLRYEILPEDLEPGRSMRETVDITRQIFDSRLDALGVKELSIRAIGDSQVEVAVPGITTAQAESITKTLESMGRLEMRLQAWTDAGIDPAARRAELEAEIQRRRSAGEEVTARTDFSELTEKSKLAGSGVTFRWVAKSEKMRRDELRGAADREPRWDDAGSWVLVRFDDRPGQHFTGDSIKAVYPAPDSESSQMAVGFEIKPGLTAQQFADWTEKNRGQMIVTMLDGQVQSMASIEGRIEGTGIIRGGSEGFTPEEITRLITVIKSGSIPSKPVLAHKFTQGPTLGEDSIRRGIYATLASLVIVAGFMLVYYRLNGVIAVTALFCNMLLLVGAMAWLDATLTLPGVAGLILTIGMAVDANILISERIREELDKGKTVAQAVKNGFERAYTTILDSNLTTFLTGFFLYQFGTGPIRGFAVTLMIGLATSMLTGVYFSRTFFGWVLARGLRSLSMLRVLASPNFRFLKHAKLCYALSAIVIVTGCGMFLAQDTRKYGMDFTGGFEVQVRLREPSAQADVLALVRQRYPNPDVVSVNAERGKAVRFQIKIKQTDLEAAQTGSAPASDPSAPRRQLADRFAADVAQLFAGRLVDEGIQNLVLAAPDDVGRVPVTCELLFDGAVRRADLETALRGNLTIDSLEGAEVGERFRLSGRFARAPQNEETARGLLSPQMKSPDGARDVLLSDPMPARSYVGPRAGKELRDAAIRAMLFSLAAIIIYARMRFSQYRFGIAAVAALVHDLLVTIAGIGFVRALGYEIEVDLTVVAALLTIIGYSINDTIVLFDRIRENLPRSSLPLPELIDRSVNQTLSRTILTALTVLVSVAILFLFNVGQQNALEGFAFAMIVGTLTGSYSTVYVASALLVNVAEWVERRKARGPAPSTPVAA